MLRELGRQLHYHRVYKLKWSVTYTAQKLGVSSASVYKLEFGQTFNPTLKTVIKVANLIDVSIDELIGRDFIPKSERKEALTPLPPMEHLETYKINHDLNRLMPQRGIV